MYFIYKKFQCLIFFSLNSERRNKKLFWVKISLFLGFYCKKLEIIYNTAVCSSKFLKNFSTFALNRQHQHKDGMVACKDYLSGRDNQRQIFANETKLLTFQSQSFTTFHVITSLHCSELNHRVNLSIMSHYPNNFLLN